MFTKREYTETGNKDALPIRCLQFYKVPNS